MNNNKNDEKMRNIRKMRILTRNDKITISNSRGVEKAHWKHYGHWVGHEFFLFWETL
jgi:hypothetical protein